MQVDHVLCENDFLLFHLQDFIFSSAVRELEKGMMRRMSTEKIKFMEKEELESFYQLSVKV